VKRLLLRLYPRSWRDRYGDEVLELLEKSQRPIRDSADVAVRAVILRAADLGRHRWAAVLLVVIGVEGLLWSVPQLQDGLTEVPMHWWSTLAVLPMAVGLAMLALSFALDPAQVPHRGGRRAGK
jgi:hypothetical protein